MIPTKYARIGSVGLLLSPFFGSESSYPWFLRRPQKPFLLFSSLVLELQSGEWQRLPNSNSMAHVHRKVVALSESEQSSPNWDGLFAKRDFLAYLLSSHQCFWVRGECKVNSPRRHNHSFGGIQKLLHSRKVSRRIPHVFLRSKYPLFRPQDQHRIHPDSINVLRCRILD